MHLSVPGPERVGKIHSLSVSRSQCCGQGGQASDMGLVSAGTILGYSNVLVEVGGEIAVSGHNKLGKEWMISIERPS